MALQSMEFPMLVCEKVTSCTQSKEIALIISQKDWLAAIVKHNGDCSQYKYQTQFEHELICYVF